MRTALIAVIVLALGGLYAWNKLKPAPAGAAPAEQASAAPAGDDKSAAAPGKGGGAGGPGGPPMGMPVEASAVKPEHIAQEIIAVGTLRSDESVMLSSEVAGRIAAINFREGQPVRKGALLFQLDDSVTKAELDQARASLSLSQRNNDRAIELSGKSLISARERDEAASKLELDRAAVKLAEAHLAKTRILAPFDGTIGLRQVSPGDYISAGQALAPLEALQTLKVDFRLAEQALSRVAVGQLLNIEVDAYPGQIFPGRVYAIDPRLAEDTRSVALRARLANDKGRLRPGLFARVRLVIADKPDAIVVPEQAIVPQGEKQFVYVIEDGKAALHPVQIGMRLPGRAEVLSGVKSGDLVITAGLQKIGPGAPVMAINLAPPPDAAPKPEPKPVDKKS